MDKIVILDFGSQTTQLIGRRIREFGVYTEIVPGDAPLTCTILDGAKGIILSGSPSSVYEPGAPVPDPAVYNTGLPLLGICYGLQRMTADHGGRVEPLPEREYGGVRVTLEAVAIQNLPPTSGAGKARAFLSSFAASLSPAAASPTASSGAAPTQRDSSFTAWMSHGDSLALLAPGFIQIGTSAHGFPAVLIHESKPWFGLQFHPEVTHCEHGRDILKAFALDICGAAPEWTMERYIEEVRANLAQRVGRNPVLLLISGGVDSTVAGALLLKTLDPDQVHLMYMDTGLMRKKETEIVSANLNRLGAKHLHIIHCEKDFLSALSGLTDPEEKRRAIGDLFIRIQEREVGRLGLPETYFLAQGTLYTDLIESGKGVGKKAHVIKSHHNVRSPLVEAKRNAGRIIEPLDRLYKDEVRALGRILGIDEDIVMRHPFPGPGLAVRILGEVTREKCDILREADDIYIRELKRRGLYDQIWQAFAVLLPIRSVGVAGDVRKYGWVLALRAIVSEDGMTADVYPFPMKDLLEISTLITNTVKDIGRVTYDISSKPPATIEWE
ncbi:glutamine-hydrolyzing GMP synthase [Gracilinema caldarium]|uniref:GMP synthase (glutamine-hydrolyzing) n=1 Tax=Gracilinema caldarium (strain ATCC 51460 / DSM 7334 / H1) TaxID=744872 RepID=F8F3P0_GRAC1|nr:glutamine-hydrolyzing GMP synthase [Gracilinema caldarium]AEJ19984.1 GMP synthase, large subunit [Gracilinema caldarium DSM 7334]